jgi:hypothetical protein
MEFAELIATPKLDNVILRNQLNVAESIEYRLCITAHHLILSACKEDSSELWVILGGVSGPTVVEFCCF